MRFRSHQSWFPREIDFPREYEDASARSEKLGRAVIADGVSTAIFSRTWAQLLTRTAVANPPPVTDDAGLMSWVGDLQRLWRDGINFKNLPWNLKPKVLSTGAQATLLLIEIEPISGTADSSTADAGEQVTAPTSGVRKTGQFSEYRLVAHALGDCNLFVIRDGTKILSFPMTDSAAFANPPHAFSSIAKNVAYAVKLQHLDDRCREGDLLVACTDAIGLWAMQEYEADSQVDWMRYWENDAAWQEDILAFRALPPGHPRRMRIDDCTLLLLQVMAESENQSEPELQPDRSDEPFVLHSDKQLAMSANKSETSNQDVESLEPNVVAQGGSSEQIVNNSDLVAEVVAQETESESVNKVPDSVPKQNTAVGSTNIPNHSADESQFNPPSPATGHDDKKIAATKESKPWYSCLFHKWRGHAKELKERC